MKKLRNEGKIMILDLYSIIRASGEKGIEGIAPNGPYLKGLSHEILRPVFWPVWIHLGLHVNRFKFYNCYDAPLIFGSYFQF